VRDRAREEEMLWSGGAQVSKEGRKATAEHALRPGGALHV
jgi:hypothetical protein